MVGLSNIMTKKFSNGELDEVLNNIEKFDVEGIRFTHLRDNVKKNFIKVRIPEFKLKDILVFLDENELIQRIPFDSKTSFHDLTLYRISQKGKELLKSFSRDSNDAWNKNSYSTNVCCQNCGRSFSERITYSETVKSWAKSQRCPNCAQKNTLVTKFD